MSDTNESKRLHEIVAALRELGSFIQRDERRALARELEAMASRLAQHGDAPWTDERKLALANTMRLIAMREALQELYDASRPIERHLSAAKTPLQDGDDDAFFAATGGACSALGEFAASREERMVVVERDATGKPTVWCDPEIAGIVAGLNENGVVTVASCSGHGHRPARIDLKDGRVLFVARDDADAATIDKLFPVNINGEPTPPADTVTVPREATDAKWLAEVDAIVASLPPAFRIRCREGGGPEDKRGTLALSVGRLLHEYERLTAAPASPPVAAQGAVVLPDSRKSPLSDFEFGWNECLACIEVLNPSLVQPQTTKPGEGM